MGKEGGRGRERGYIVVDVIGRVRCDGGRLRIVIVGVVAAVIIVVAAVVVLIVGRGGLPSASECRWTAS